MPRVDLLIETPISRSVRARQLEGMFDVPAAETSRVEWHLDVPLEARPWSIGLIVGPSGSGKSQIARRLFGALVDAPLTWGTSAVVDDFDPARSMEDVSGICSAVGFNTIPAWLRPFHVLSNGEQFRVSLARRLLEGGELVVVDEFTSVVDRQVAQIGSHAVQKWVRRHGRRFVAVTCHYDVVEWLQPDWVLDPSAGTFTWRSLQRRPALDVTIGPVPYAAWRLFASYHYLTADLHVAARCYALWVGDRIAAFAGMLHRPHNAGDGAPIWGCSRLVTLPDFQGLGLAFVLIDAIGAAYRAGGMRVHTYPAHPSLIRAFDRSAKWAMRKRPGTFSAASRSTTAGRTGGRPCAVFSYEGPAAPDEDAARLLQTYHPDAAARIRARIPAPAAS